jgi:hypothetical protein
VIRTRRPRTNIADPVRNKNVKARTQRRQSTCRSPSTAHEGNGRALINRRSESVSIDWQCTWQCTSSTRSSAFAVRSRFAAPSAPQCGPGQVRDSLGRCTSPVTDTPPSRGTSLRAHGDGAATQQRPSVKRPNDYHIRRFLHQATVTSRERYIRRQCNASQSESQSVPTPPRSPVTPSPRPTAQCSDQQPSLTTNSPV